MQDAQNGAKAPGNDSRAVLVRAGLPVLDIHMLLLQGSLGGAVMSTTTS